MPCCGREVCTGSGCRSWFLVRHDWSCSRQETMSSWCQGTQPHVPQPMFPTLCTACSVFSGWLRYACATSLIGKGMHLRV